MKKGLFAITCFALLLSGCNSNGNNNTKISDDSLNTKEMFTKHENMRMSAVFDVPGTLFNDEKILNVKYEMYREYYKNQFVEGVNRTVSAKFTKEQFFYTFNSNQPMTNSEISSMLQERFNIESITFIEDEIDFIYSQNEKEMCEKTNINFVYNYYEKDGDVYKKNIDSSENDVLFFFVNYPEGFEWNAKKQYATYDINKLPDGKAKYFQSYHKDLLSSFKLYFDENGRPLKIETGKIPLMYNLSTVINFEYDDYSFKLPEAEYQFKTNGCQHLNKEVCGDMQFENPIHYTYCNDCYLYLSCENCELDSNLHCDKCGLDKSYFENFYNDHGIKIDTYLTEKDSKFVEICVPLVGMASMGGDDSKKPSFMDVNEAYTGSRHYTLDDGYKCDIYFSQKKGEEIYYDYFVISDKSAQIETLYKFCVGQVGYTNLLDN